MIIEKKHYRNTGTHSATALLDWLDTQSWPPFRRGAWQSDITNAGKTFANLQLLPQPTLTWVRGDDRFAANNPNYRGYDTEALCAAGWTKQDLFDTDQVIELCRNQWGFRCQSCQGVFAADRGQMPQTPKFGEVNGRATCAHCFWLASKALAGDRAAEQRLVAMPDSLRRARATAQELRGAKRNRDVSWMIDHLCAFLGAEPETKPKAADAA